MMKIRTHEEIVSLVHRKVNMLLLELMPEPTCPQKKLKWRWEVERVKKEVANRVWPEYNGLNIDIKV